MAYVGAFLTKKKIQKFLGALVSKTKWIYNKNCKGRLSNFDESLTYFVMHKNNAHQCTETIAVVNLQLIHIRVFSPQQLASYGDMRAHYANVSSTWLSVKLRNTPLRNK